MAESSLYAGERAGPGIFQIGRIGFDQGSQDLSTYNYTGTLRSERVAPAGTGALINFRRVDLHLLTSGDYTFTVKVWVDDGRTTLGSGTTQTVEISGSAGSLREVTESVEIEGEGSHIQVEVTIKSGDTTGIFLIESIQARGRVIRRTSARGGESS